MRESDPAAMVPPASIAILGRVRAATGTLRRAHQFDRVAGPNVQIFSRAGRSGVLRRMLVIIYARRLLACSYGPGSRRAIVAVGQVLRCVVVQAAIAGVIGSSMHKC